MTLVPTKSQQDITEEDECIKSKLLYYKTFDHPLTYCKICQETFRDIDKPKKWLTTKDITVLRDCAKHP